LADNREGLSLQTGAADADGKPWPWSRRVWAGRWCADLPVLPRECAGAVGVGARTTGGARTPR